MNINFVNAAIERQFQFYTNDSKPFGTSFSDWTAKWWNWLLSIPAKDNPRLDTTGEKCGIDQNDQNVWFLAQISEGHVERNCVIPAGKSIFIPILTGECDFKSDPEIKSEVELRTCATSGIEGANVYVSIDGIPIKDIVKIKSPLFNYTIIKDNIFSADIKSTGPTQAVIDGYYAFIKNIPIGKHIIEFSANAIDNPIIGTYSFSYLS